MTRKLMPDSGVLIPHVVMSRDAAVAGVISVDGNKGVVDLTTKYVQLSAYNAKMTALDASILQINNSITAINTSIQNINTTLGNKAAKGANSDITSLSGLTTALSIAQGGTGAKNAADARTNLQLNRFYQLSSQTKMNSANDRYSLVLNDSGFWGAYDNTNSVSLALPVASGGTGALDATGARNNLGLGVSNTVKFTIGEFAVNSDTPIVAGGRIHSTLYAANGTIIRAQARQYTEVRNDGKNYHTIAVRSSSGSERYFSFSEDGYFPLINGGTGASDAAGARNNIQAMYVSPSSITTENLNVFGASPGLYFQGNAANTTTGLYPIQEAGSLNVYKNGQGANARGHTQEYISYPSYRRFIRGNNEQTWGSGWVEMYSTANTTVDSNGFIKKASPIVKIFADGTTETNNESEGATVERTSIGQYLITGVLGTNSDTSWGGPDGGFELPKDRNGQELVWLDYEVKDDGSILVKTYHRTYPNSPVFAQNTKEGYKEADPIDIPAGLFISVRVEMPEGSIWHTKKQAIMDQMAEVVEVNENEDTLQDSE